MTHYIIDFVNDATDTDINEYLSACGATVIKTFSAFEKVVLVECLTEPPVNDIVASNVLGHERVLVLCKCSVEFLCVDISTVVWVI